MKKLRFMKFNLLLFINLFLNSEISIGQPVLQSIDTIQHSFICTDYTQGKVFVFSKDGNIEWEYPAKDCNDVWALPNGNYLFNTGTGVKEVTKDKKIVFEYQSQSEIYACQRLSNGNTFIVENNTGRILEISPQNKIVKEVRLLPEGKDGGHIYIRNSRKLENGNYLVTFLGDKVVREYNKKGKIVMEIPAPSGAHSAIRLKNGNTLISTGDLDGEPCVFEVDKTGKTVWSVNDKDLNGIGLRFMTGMQRLPNGNTIITNWLGHDQSSKAPHIMEITPDKKIVWSFADHKNLITVSSVQLLDVPGDVTKGQIQH